MDWYAIGQAVRLAFDGTASVLVGGCVGWLLAYRRYALKEAEMSETPYRPGKHGPIRLSRSAPAPTIEREPFFFIDDDEYVIIKNPSPAMGLRFIEMVRTRGEAVAQAELFDMLVGHVDNPERPGSLRALSKLDGITEGEVAALMGVVGDKLMAVANKVSGN